jgi:hypothetical protein
VKIYFAGGETPDHRKRLIEAGVHGISISYWNLRKRYKTERWKVADNFPDDIEILLDAGALNASKTEDWSEDDWRAYGEEYLDFVENNTSRLTLITEFDSTVLGREYIEQMREEFWSDVSPHRFLPVWHEAHGGLGELAIMAHEFDHVAIPNMAIDDRRVLSNRLNSLITQHGVKMHGLGITKPDVMQQVRFDSVSSTSWVSPMRFGDTIVWDVNRLRRYPTTRKEQARRRHRALFEREGFDSEKIEEGDPSEVVRLSIWSWLQFEAALNRRKGLRAVADDEEEVEDDEVADTWPDERESTSAETATTPPDNCPPEVRKNGNTLPVPVAEVQPLPVMGFERVRKVDEQGQEIGSMLIARSTQVSQRKCDTCYVAANCPLMEPGSACKFGFPIELATKDQLVAAMSSVIETQMARVAFGRFAEELEGGYPDPNLSSEIDRFFKIIEKMRDITDDRLSLKIEAEARGGAGILSAIFGAKPQDPIDPQKAEQALNDAMEGVVDADVLD